MNNTDRWLLPDAIEEVQPPMATHVEALRRRTLDLFQTWGYEQVMPPQAEFLESLQTGLGNDLDLLTFKVTDQLSGRLLGISPDLTQQVARMDAHSIGRMGVARYCYCAPVLHARKSSLLSSRNPLQVGAEIYGSSELSADIEVICLMVALAQSLGLDSLTLDIGHVSIYHAVIDALALNDTQRAELYGLMRQRALPELKAWVHANVADPEAQALLMDMPTWSGSVELLHDLTSRLAQYQVESQLTALQDLLAVLQQRHPEVRLHLDLAELRDYNYHTGLVFSLFHKEHGHAIAKGGRYDDTGAAYGRSRPATGFSADLKTLGSLTDPGLRQVRRRIYAPVGADASLQQTVEQLRGEGAVVVQGFSGEPAEAKELNCSHRLETLSGTWQVVAV
ncbi:ATP phosphoribosyltransferase regulatory subunit [Salinispirillum marinum]|uniref:ATP phosphoribosyltransferase regulatory subunit n=2 Tax=Saccharospirillaceae TaxID=255527 RepID=A0ABV8BJE3_9GAMM